jgi:WD40 repeat protein
VNAVKWNPSGSMFATGGSDRKIKLWEVIGGMLLMQLEKKAHGRWFSLGTLASSTTKTGRHDIAEILLKVGLNTKNQIKSTHLYCKESTNDLTER